MSDLWKVRRWYLLRRHEGWGWSTVMDLIGDGTVGGHSVPTSWKSWRRQGKHDRLIASVSNDAFGLSLRRAWEPYGDRDEGNVHVLNRAEARWLAFVIVRWMLMDWLGLRRRLYYFALDRHLRRKR